MQDLGSRFILDLRKILHIIYIYLMRSRIYTFLKYLERYKVHDNMKNKLK